MSSQSYRLRALARRAQTEHRRLLALAEDIKLDAPIPNYMQSRAMNAAHAMFTLIGELLAEFDKHRDPRGAKRNKS